MGVFSRTMLMLTMAWLVGLLVTFLFLANNPEPSWREKFIAEANIQRAIAYRYVDIKGGVVAERGHTFGPNSDDQQLEPENLGFDGGGSTDPLPGARVRADATLIAIERGKGDAMRAAAAEGRKALEGDINRLNTEIAEAQRARRAADNDLARAREAARNFAFEMQSYRSLITRFQAMAFNMDYEIKRLVIESDALTAELAQVNNDLRRIDGQQVALEDAFWDVSRKYAQTVRMIGRYTNTDPNLAMMADTAGRGWLRGKVVGVGADPRLGVVSISIGSNEGVQENQVFSIYRSGELVAKMRVENVRPNVSVGTLLPEFRGRVVLENDSVKVAEVFGGATMGPR